MVAAVRTQGLVKRYPDVVAVDGIDLEIARGECYALLGPNGAGKTTTVEMLEGLTIPDAGVVEILGQQWGKGNDRALRARIGVALQETQLADKLTVEETLRLFRSFYPRGRSVEEIIALLELGEKRKSFVGKLSGGQKQRLALGCALVGSPELLFLDEPTTGLDPQARRSVWAIVEAFRKEGGTVVLTTHYMEEAAQLCQRIAIVDHGKIIALGTPDELVAALGATERVEMNLPGDDVLASLSALPGIDAARREGDLYILSTRSATAILPRVLTALSAMGREATMLTTRRATLEDVFIQRTGRGLRDA